MSDHASSVERILGIDPGYIRTGYALVEGRRYEPRHIHSGSIALRGSSAQRLATLADHLSECIERYQPTELAIESAFFHRDAQATLKLGYVSGVVILLAARYALSVHEYSPRAVKKSIVGTGTATKEQVQFMVLRLLKIGPSEHRDESDALAIALCHLFAHKTRGVLSGESVS